MDLIREYSYTEGERRRVSSPAGTISRREGPYPQEKINLHFVDDKARR